MLGILLYRCAHEDTETPRSELLAPGCQYLTFSAGYFLLEQLPLLYEPSRSCIGGILLQLPPEAMEHKVFAQLALSVPDVNGYTLLECLSVGYSP